ncbi:MAG: hypothetical protein M3252_03775, partial [Actinomycetota bacterium]|nr:hypothetical protein [Actinomycetota bacterium]
LCPRLPEQPGVPLEIVPCRPPCAVRERRLGDELARLRVVGNVAEVGDLLGEDALVRPRTTKPPMNVRQSFFDLGYAA